MRGVWGGLAPRAPAVWVFGDSRGLGSGLVPGVGFPEPAPAQPGGGLAHALMRAPL